MNATEEKPQQINDVEIEPPSILGRSAVNEARTVSKIDTWLTHPCSLIVLARHLASVQRDHPAPHLVSTLRQQIYNFDADPEGMRPRIVATIEAIENAA